jgi:hypothetical protein
MSRLMQKWQSTKPSEKSKLFIWVLLHLLHYFVCLMDHLFSPVFSRAKKKRMTKDEQLAQRVLDRKARKAELEKARGFR